MRSCGILGKRIVEEMRRPRERCNELQIWAAVHPSTQLSVGLRVKAGQMEGGKRPKAGAPEVVWADVPSPANAVDGDRLAVVNVGAAAVRPWSIHLSREVKPRCPAVP